jgi:hypothetical protein
MPQLARRRHELVATRNTPPTQPRATRLARMELDQPGIHSGQEPLALISDQGRSNWSNPRPRRLHPGKQVFEHWTAPDGHHIREPSARDYTEPHWQ